MSSKEYTNGEITIIWDAEKCKHSGICVKTLPQAYNPKDRPWIKMDKATSAEFIDQVAKCPSGALSIKKPSRTISVDREDDGKKGVFTIYQNGKKAGHMTYTWAGETKFIIDHTIVEEGFEGMGIGKRLVSAGVEFARNNHLKIVPLCTFANAQFKKNPDYKDVEF